jgi:hypothetical protein
MCICFVLEILEIELRTSPLLDSGLLLEPPPQLFLLLFVFQVRFHTFAWAALRQ